MTTPSSPSSSSPVPDTGTLHTCHPDQMEWLPWAMQGAYFKLLHADAASGRFTLMIKFDPGAAAPIHRHIGAVEGYMLEGGFHYRDEPERPFNAGCYLWESDGAVHQPVSPHGAVMFAIFHGPVEGLDDAGNLTGRVGWKWHVDKWNAAGHHYVPTNIDAADTMPRNQVDR